MLTDTEFQEALRKLSPGGIGIMDLRGFELLTQTGYIARMLGMSPEAFREQVAQPGFGGVVHADDLPLVTRHFTVEVAQANDQQVFELEYRMIGANGQVHWVQQRDTVYTREADGSVRTILIVQMEISRIKELETQLDERTQSLRRMGMRDLESLRREVGQILDLVEQYKSEEASPLRRQKLLGYMRQTAEALRDATLRLSQSLEGGRAV